MTFQPFPQFLCAVLILATLNGCGGGASSSNTSSNTPVQASAALVFVTLATGNVSGYSLSSSGSFSPLSNAAISAGASPVGMAVSGNNLFIADAASTNIYEYSFDSAGKLTPLTVSPYRLPVVVTPPSTSAMGTSNLTTCGDKLFASWDSGPVTIMAITNGIIGQFTFGLWHTGMDHSSPIAVDPTCTNVYVTGVQSNSVFGIQNTPPMYSSQTPVLAGSSPMSLAMDPSGKFLYVANYGSDDVSGFSVASNGSLTALSPSRTSVGASPIAITITRHFVYVANFGTNTIHAFSFDPANGLLTPVGGSPFQPGAQPIALTVAQVATTSNPNQLFLLCANQGSADISAFTITSTGSLQAFPGSPLPLSSSPRSIVVAIPH